MNPRRRIPAAFQACCLWLMTLPAFADAGWFYSGDARLRLDLQVLNDADIIRLPVNQWPLPRAAVQYALENARTHLARNAAVSASLERVRAAMAASTRGAFHAGLRAGDSGLWRDFDTQSRDRGEAEAGYSFAGDRVSLGVQATGVADPADGDEVRLDGSHATLRLGNWLVSAHTLDRWWGPGHEGSLILSNNARPMPTLMVERAEARPFESDWLRWLGPWRFSFGVGQMENHRADIDSPLFMAWRVSAMPFHDVEVGVSRTAQFCGEQLKCDLESFGNMLIGNDNVGIDTTEQDEPGNQMAGFDLRWNSPIGNLPYAVYAQYIGEDESSYLPAKFLAQLGAEVWKPLATGGIIQGWLEYTSTTCSANSRRGPYYNCAYNQGRFDVEGYRYKGRVVGYTADRDAENYALGARYVAPDATEWSAVARTSRLNRDDVGDVRNTVASVPTSYDALELGWKGRLFGQPLAVDLGVQSLEPVGGDRDVSVFGFVGWRHTFDP